jgi:hypothetical protein
MFHEALGRSSNCAIEGLEGEFVMPNCVVSVVE